MECFSVQSCLGGYHVYKAQTLLVLAYLNERYWPHFLVVLLPCSLLFSLPSPHEGKLEKGGPMNQGHYQQSTSSEKSYKKCCLVQTLARVDSEGGKFRNTGVDHKKKRKLAPHGNNPLYDSALNGPWLNESLSVITMTFRGTTVLLVMNSQIRK